VLLIPGYGEGIGDPKHMTYVFHNIAIITIHLFHKSFFDILEALVICEIPNSKGIMYS
jgi:hypothetical protein